MKRNIYILVISLFLLSGCSVFKAISTLKSGEVEVQNGIDEVPFENRDGLIIINVIIKGDSYNFIFDTGAPCAISKDLANKLNLKADFNINSKDAKGNIAKTGFVELANLKIGNTVFKDIGCAIIDFGSSNELKCVKIDGIIGANLMRKLYWQINYDQQKMTFAQDFKTLNVSESSQIIDFKPAMTGTPVINMVVSDDIIEKNVKFDTGFNGDLNLSMNTYKALIKDKTQKVVKGYGRNAVGAYGSGSDTSYYVKINKVQINTLVLKDIITTFGKNDLAILGNNILKNFLVCIDWKENKIYLEQKMEPENHKLENFGFKATMKDNQLIIGFLFENSPASKIGLKIGDQILSINGTDYTTITHEQFCDVLFRDAEWQQKDQIKVTYKNKEETRTCNLIKENLFKF